MSVEIYKKFSFVKDSIKEYFGQKRLWSYAFKFIEEWD